ncbi:MAG: carboxypeptidase-like regulatory domain-containing protein, partial [Bacteroidota bacterium]
QLEKQNGLSFSYQVSALENIQLPPCSIKGDQLEQFLQELFANQQLEYRIVDGQRVLLRRSLLDIAPPTTIQKAILAGNVFDTESKLPLADVAVYLDTLSLGALTDMEGNFSFEIPSSMQDRKVIVQIIGYAQKTVRIIDLQKDSKIAIEANPVSLGPVTVTETVPVLQNKLPSGAIRLNTSPLLQNNGSSLAGNDLFRSIQTLPGISANNDLSAAVKIRGSSGDETLTILDGIPIYKAEHYFGVFSAVNANYVQSTEIYKNALPVAYGGKTGGMLLMESEGNRYNRTNGIIDLNLLNTSLVFNTPIGKKLSLIVSGRTTYADAADNPLFNAFEDNLSSVTNDATQGLGRPGLVETTPSFSFYDWNAKLLYKINDKHNLSFSFYRSFDDLLNDYEQSYNIRTTNNRPAVDEESFSNAEVWENTGASLRYNWEMKNNWSVNATGYYTQYENDGIIESELNREFRNLEFSIWSFENNQE